MLIDTAVDTTHVLAKAEELRRKQKKAEFVILWPEIVKLLRTLPVAPKAACIRIPEHKVSDRVFFMIARNIEFFLF